MVAVVAIVGADAAADPTTQYPAGAFAFVAYPAAVIGTVAMTETDYVPYGDGEA